MNQSIIIGGKLYLSMPCESEDFNCNCCDFEDVNIPMCDNGRCPACDIANVEDNRLFVFIGDVETIKLIDVDRNLKK